MACQNYLNWTIKMQIQLLNQKIDEHFGKEPFYNEAILEIVKKKKI